MNQITQTTALVAALAASAGAMAQDDIHPSLNSKFWGVGWRLGQSGHSVEIGYLNQYIDSASGNDLMEHILSLNVFMNY